jgi:hypothetical protein
VKFKLNDEVRIRKDSKLAHGMYANREGMIIGVLNKTKHPYVVRIPGWTPNTIGIHFYSVRFHANELERR